MQAATSRGVLPSNRLEADGRTLPASLELACCRTPTLQLGACGTATRCSLKQKRRPYGSPQSSSSR